MLRRLIVAALITAACCYPTLARPAVVVEDMPADRLNALEEPADLMLNAEQPVFVVKPKIRFPLTADEFTLVYQIVEGEAGGESLKGKKLVAQTILDTCEKDGIRPAQVRKKYQYSGWKPTWSKSVEEAVNAVFNDGERVTEEKTYFFYAPKLCRSKWHESQTFVIEEGGHRFFR